MQLPSLTVVTKAHQLFPHQKRPTRGRKCSNKLDPKPTVIHVENEYYRTDSCLKSRLVQKSTSSTIQSSIAVKDHKIQVKVTWKIQNTRMAGSDPAVYNRYPDKSIPAVSAQCAKPLCAKPQCAKPHSGIGVCVGSPVHGWGAGSPPFEQEP